MIPKVAFKITARHFVAMGHTEGFFVKNVTPIVKYMVGWPLHRVKAYCDKKRWTLERIKDDYERRNKH